MEKKTFKQTNTEVYQRGSLVILLVVLEDCRKYQLHHISRCKW